MGAAIVSINIHLQTISRLLDAQEISPRARAYIIDDADDLIAHSDPATMNRLLGIWSKNADGAVAVDTTT
ncbi:adenylate/guanylate cyclase domain-containing protein, partial [Rhizobium ruizarguesonis]